MYSTWCKKVQREHRSTEFLLGVSTKAPQRLGSCDDICKGGNASCDCREDASLRFSREGMVIVTSEELIPLPYVSFMFETLLSLGTVCLWLLDVVLHGIDR